MNENFSEVENLILKLEIASGFLEFNALLPKKI